MDCERVRESMFLARDEEIEPELLASFREHLGFCPRCARQFHYWDKLLTMVRERCTRERAPDGLRHRILHLVSHREVSSEILE